MVNKRHEFDSVESVKLWAGEYTVDPSHYHIQVRTENASQSAQIEEDEFYRIKELLERAEEREGE